MTEELNNLRDRKKLLERAYRSEDRDTIESSLSNYVSALTAYSKTQENPVQTFREEGSRVRQEIREIGGLGKEDRKSLVQVVKTGDKHLREQVERESRPRRRVVSQKEMPFSDERLQDLMMNFDTRLNAFELSQKSATPREFKQSLTEALGSFVCE